MPPVAVSRAVHPADRAIRTRDGSAPAAAAVLAAFAAYETGADDAARTALQAVGLTSPYLDWKLLLRGLLAHAAGDHTRAADNWQRLDPRRLPAKLAAPVWATFDPARATPTVARQARKLTGSPLLDRLAKLRTLVGRGRSLKAAFAEAEAVLPLVREEAPQLVPRLAEAFYRAVKEHGDRTDLPRLLAVFGPVADDPDFHKLEAQAYEDSRRPDEAAKHWLAYARWLADDRPGWPPAVRHRARAEVVFRAAGLARPSESLALLRSACELAPEWDAPAQKLVHHLAAAGQDVEAETVARGLLARRPDHLATLDALADLYARSDRPLDLLAVRRRALTLNPLDAGRRASAVAAAVRAARAQVIAGDVPAAAATLVDIRDVGDDAGSAGYFVLRAMLARKLGRREDAATDLARAAADPDDRLAVGLLAAVDAGLVKLKPAERKPFTAALAGVLTGPATPREALRLVVAFDQLKADRVSYRGQVGHAGKIDAVLLAAGPGEAADYEALGLGLAGRKLRKPVGKLAPDWRRRFPASPVFPLLEVEAGLSGGGVRFLPYRLINLLREARRLAEGSRELRHRALLDRIAELEKRASPFDLIRTLFDEA